MYFNFPMGITGFNFPYSNMGFFNFGNYNYMNNYNLLFNYRPPMFIPIMPKFEFAGYNPTKPVTVDNNNELNPKQKAQIEEIQQMKYDSENLQAKLKENDNINDYAKFLETNNDYSISSTLDTPGGGKIYLYSDKNGNKVGSISKDKNGKVENVALNIADGGEISLNDRKGNDGKIDSRVAMSKNYWAQPNGENITYGASLAKFLDSNKGYTVQSNQNSDGSIEAHYMLNGQEIAFVRKDSDGKITLYNEYSDTEDGKTKKSIYSDVNGDGVLDVATEGVYRFDIDLT